MEVIQHHNSKGGRFTIETDGEEKAAMTYIRSTDHLVIMDSTRVDDSLRGQGVGYLLLETAVNWARQNDIKMIPLCPFVKSVFEKKTEYADVLHQKLKD